VSGASTAPSSVHPLAEGPRSAPANRDAQPPAFRTSRPVTDRSRARRSQGTPVPAVHSSIPQGQVVWAPQGVPGRGGRAEVRRLDRRSAPRSPPRSARHDDTSVVVVALVAVPVVAVIVLLVTSQDA